MDRYLCIFIILLLATASCNKDLPLPDIKAEKKIVLLGEFVAGAPIAIRGGQSLPVTSSGSKFELVSGLTLDVKDQSGTAETLAGIEDAYSGTLHTLAFSGQQPVKPGSKYTVTATHSNLGTATVAVEVPSAFKADVPGITPVIFGGDSAYLFNIKISDPAGEQYYSIECIKQTMDVKGYFLYKSQWLNILENKFVYDSLVKENVNLQKKFDTIYHNKYTRQYLYTDDPNTENLKENLSSSSYRRILLSDYNFNGSTYNTKVYVRKEYLTAFGDLSGRGRLIFSVRSVSKAYFSYLKSYEGISAEGTFNSNDIPPNMIGNVVNGLGVIGGVYKNEFIYLFDTWEF